MDEDTSEWLADLSAASEDDVLPGTESQRELYRAEQLGEWKDGNQYRVLLDVEPSPDEREAYDPDEDVDGWSVVLHRTTPAGESEPEIVRFDNRHPGDGEPHADKLWLDPLDGVSVKEWRSDRPSSERAA